MNAHLQEFAADLTRRSSAEVRLDHATRLLYATDASNYRILPLAVVIPRHVEDVLATVEACTRLGLPMLPRGAASSLAGQTVGEAVVIDFTKHLDAVQRIDGARRRVLVEPGISLDRLNARLAPYGLQVGPDPASSDRATVGGIIGNNSTGAHSILYGNMADHVISLRTVLADGQEAILGPASWAEVGRRGQGRGLEAGLYRHIPALIEAHAGLIDAEFPKYWRRAGGYNLDHLHRQWAAGDGARPDFNLAPLVVGSEGTLALITEAEIGLTPIPRHKGLAILHFPSHEAAFRAVPGLLELQPAAIELIDDYLLRLTRAAPAWNRRLTFVEGDPTILYILEFAGEEEKYIADRMAALTRHLARSGYRQPLIAITDRAGMANVWTVRKAGLGLLLSMRGDAKPLPCIEDVAVPPEHLADYMAELRALIADRGVAHAMYAHASAGCVHVRPILSLKRQVDIDHLVALTTAAGRLAKKYNGVPSSEHGDGLARSYLNPEFFGPGIYGLFEQIKALFDPANLLNPGKVVHPQPPDAHLRYGPAYHTAPISPVWDWSHDGSFAQGVEMCSGVGVCRKLDVGVMCPSFQATKEEMHATRGRATLLRAALTGELPGGLHNPDLATALDLCLGCKACKSECPTGVDMTKLKAEAYAQKYRSQRPPLSARFFGHIDRVAALAARVAPLANAGLRFPPARALANRLLRLHPARSLPPFQRRTFTARFRSHPPAFPAAGPRVALFPDTFTQFNAPQQGMAAARVLAAAGYAVELTPRFCCGRPLLSQGLVPEAKARAQKLIAALLPYAQAGVPVVGLEPSCVLTIRDDYPDLVPGPDAQAVAATIRLFDEFVADLLHRTPTALPLKPDPRRYLVHGHCHQKALVGVQPTLTVLNAIPKARAEAIDAGCCGMAGAFGYAADHYEISVKIANDRLLPAIQAAPGAVLIANGISCRDQIADLGDRQAVHLAEALAALVE